MSGCAPTSSTASSVTGCARPALTWRLSSPKRDKRRKCGRIKPRLSTARARWWRREIIKTAKRADHYAYLKPRPWWSMLRMTVGGARLRFVTSIHHVATAYTGVMAITSFADIHILGEEFSAPEDTFVETSWEPFTFSHHDKVEDRVDELYEWLDRSLAVALQELMRRTLGI